MSQFTGKTALITGGAEGIGFAAAKALGAQGMHVVIGDIDGEQLQQAEQALLEQNISVMSQVMDVTDTEHWRAIADAAIARFGKVHMLVNNAGVSAAPGDVENIKLGDWRWVMDVNLNAVFYGMQTVVPLIKQHGEGGWIVNVASMAGMAGVPYAGPYTASKIAVVGLSESWHVELKPSNIHVGVLCPGFVRTRIAQSHRNRQEHYVDEPTPRPKTAKNNPMQDIVDAGIDPDLVGERVLEALELGELYIFTHPSYRSMVKQRFEAIDDAFARAKESPLLKDLEEPDLIFSFK